MVFLSHQKRCDYEKAQPQFWKHADGAKEAQAKWFEELLLQDHSILLIAQSQNKLQGFIIGRIISAPEVYNPGGLTLMIDDFCVAYPSEWQVIGGKLLAELNQLSQKRGAVQVVVVCGAHDEFKRDFLKKSGLNIASEWYVGRIT